MFHEGVDSSKRSWLIVTFKPSNQMLLLLLGTPFLPPLSLSDSYLPFGTQLSLCSDLHEEATLASLWHHSCGHALILDFLTWNFNNLLP